MKFPLAAVNREEVGLGFSVDASTFKEEELEKAWLLAYLIVWLMLGQLGCSVAARLFGRNCYVWLMLGCLVDAL